MLWFAVVGTLWNSIGIGMSLFAICQIEAFGVQDINLQENLLFATIISAVDPVAVLSVFEDVSVNEQLYIVVFGECLFNDAVTVVSGPSRRNWNWFSLRTGSVLYLGMVLWLEEKKIERSTYSRFNQSHEVHLKSLV